MSSSATTTIQKEKGGKLKQMRLSLNRSLKEVASEANIHVSHLSKIERGLVLPSPIVESKIEAVLHSERAIPAKEINHIRVGVDDRNKLNELLGKEWIQETVSIWRQKGLGAMHAHAKIEKLHPAPFSYQDVARLIKFFTKSDAVVLDPFVGVGSTLKAAALEGRRGIGIELSSKWAQLARQRLREEVNDPNNQQVWCMDVREGIKKLKDDSIDFIVTSPPYWSILNKRADHKVNSVRIANGLDTNYSNDSKDLGNIESYPEFVSILADIFHQLSTKLKAEKYCAIIVSDFKHGDKFYTFHSDLCNKISEEKLRLQGIKILCQTQKALFPYGYPFAYVPNIHHQYILIFRKPKQKSNFVYHKKTKETVNLPSDLRERIDVLRTLPHTKNQMSSRQWGHQRHSICSFPSN